MADTDTHLQNLCQQIADELSAGPTVEWAKDHGFELTLRDDFDPEEDDADDLDSYEDRPGATEWMEGVYDINYVVGGDGSYLGARCMVAGGGPTVWVDFEDNYVIGTWASAPVRVAFRDEWGISDYLEELCPVSAR
jgi:hypothetical protein